MRLFATSDLHLDQKENLANLERYAKEHASRFPARDCLILAGDICENEKQLAYCLSLLRPLYQEIVWLPGNHELWIRPSQRERYSGSEQRYRALVNICRDFSVHTPEDDYLCLQDDVGNSLTIAPLFILYDYSFSPDDIETNKALDWALDSGVMCSDEVLLLPGPHAHVADWCAERVHYSLQRLQSIQAGEVLLANHFPLNQKSFYLNRIPRFSIWCGTRLTENWHQRFNTRMVVSGHLHMPGKQMIDGVEFREVSLGYPGQWDASRPMMEFFEALYPERRFRRVNHSSSNAAVS